MPHGYWLQTYPGINLPSLLGMTIYYSWAKECRRAFKMPMPETRYVRRHDRQAALFRQPYQRRYRARRSERTLGCRLAGRKI
jgi:hypothetical protein